MNFEKAKNIYKNRIRNAADFTYVFVGNIRVDQMSLIQKYMRNIASEEKEKETFVNHNIEPKKGNTTIHFNRSMEIPKTTDYVHLTGAVKYWQQTAYEMYMIGELLSKRFLQTIREEEGGSYGVQINGSLQKLPSSRFDIVLNFDCKPEKKRKTDRNCMEGIKSIEK
ncbi:insulinase family protein [Flavobacterium sp. ARAG 55.4]|uniref:insulinase family protein n=1 Tax=Flavobacterium sp. ARAG 55.4 TaxID=3451357 RepID=UPI003F44A1D4